MFSDPTSHHSFILPQKLSGSASAETTQAEITNNFLLLNPGDFSLPQLTDLSAVSDLLNTHFLHGSHEFIDTIFLVFLLYFWVLLSVPSMSSPFYAHNINVSIPPFSPTNLLFSSSARVISIPVASAIICGR